ncbi:MAG: flagellar motor protein MotB [Elusimicrobia bacterium]|nr:flagellar motor protein MotB [Elusimicrobiota bacterium]
MLLRAPKGFVDESDPKVCQIGHPAPPWLVNYADLMTEMVCFFVILYALSAALNKNMQKAREQLQEMMKNGKMAGEVKIDKEGLKISLEEQGKNVFFESGSAELTPEMKDMIAKLAPILRPLAEKHDIIVEGHTDNVPIHNDLYLNNWELSSARSTNVVEEFVKTQGYAAERLGAAGYGENRPVVPNDTPENRARNRRVVFFVKNTLSAPEVAQPPPKGAAAPAVETKAAAADEGKTEIGSLSAGGATGMLKNVLSKIRGK